MANDFSSQEIQRQIDTLAKTGGVLRVPPGVCHIQETIRVSTSGIEIECDGTVFMTYAPDCDAIHVASFDGSHIHGFALRGARFCSSQYPRTAGAYVHLDTVQTVSLERIVMDGPFIGFHLSDTTVLDLTKFDIRSPQDHGIGILIDGEADSNDHWIHHGIIRGNPDLKSRAAIEIRNSGFSIIDSVDGYQCGHGLILRADHYMPRMPNRAPVEHIWTRSCSWDTCTHHGMLIETYNGVSIRRIRSSGDWFASNKGSGVRTVGEHINGIDFIDAHSFLNDIMGFDFENGTNITVQMAKVAGNGHYTPGIYPGIRFAAGTSRFKVENSIVGETEDIQPGAHSVGILIEAGAGGRYIIRNNDVNGNCLANILDQGSGLRVIEGNIDWFAIELAASLNEKARLGGGRAG